MWRRCLSQYPLTQRLDVGATVEPEGSRDGSTTLGLGKTGGRRVQVGTPARSRSAFVRYDDSTRATDHHDEPQQFRLRRSLPATRAHADRQRPTHRRPLYRLGLRGGEPVRTALGSDRVDLGGRARHAFVAFVGRLVGADVDAPSGHPSRQPGVLTFLADRQ